MFYFSNILAGFLSSTKNAQKDFNWNCYITVLTIKRYKHINIFIFLFFSSGHTEFFSYKKTKYLQLLLSSFLAFKGRMVPMPIPLWHSFSDGNQELWQLNGQNSEMSCPSCLHFVQPVQCKMQWNCTGPRQLWVLGTGNKVLHFLTCSSPSPSSSSHQDSCLQLLTIAHCRDMIYSSPGHYPLEQIGI